MKKYISKSVVAFILALSLIVSIPVPKAEAAVDIIGGISLTITFAQIIMDTLTTVNEKNAARANLVNQWSLTSTPGNSSYMYRVSADDLATAVMQFNQNGLPCEVVDVTWSGSTIRAIRMRNEPFNMVTGTRLIPDTNLINHYFAPGGYFLYAIGTDSAYSLYFIRSAIDTLNQTATAIANTLTTISSRLSTLNGYVDGVEGLLDSVVGYLIAQSTKLSDIVTNTSNTVVSLRYTDSNGATNTAASLLYAIRYAANSIDSKFTTANSHLSNIANRTLNTASRLQTTVSGSTFTAAELLYSIANTNNSININLGSVTGYVDGVESSLTSLGGYVDGVESALSNIYASLYGQADSSGAGRSVGVSAQQISTSLSLFASNVDTHLLAVEGYIDGLESAFSSSNSHLNTIAIRVYNNGVKLDNILSRLNDMYGYMYITEEQAAERGLTRAGELVPVGIDELVARGTALSGEVLTNVISIVSPVGLIQQGVQTIADIIEDFEISDQNSILRNIYGALHTSVDDVDYTVAQLNSFTAQSTNDIYEWLTSADLLDDNTVVDFIDSTGDYVNDAILNGNNIVSLFYHAYLNVVPSWQSSLGSDPFGEAIQYFDDLNGGAA